MNPCKACGTPYVKRIEQGRELVNICPITNLCIPCLRVSISQQAKPMPAVPFDAKAAQFKDEE